MATTPNGRWEDERSRLLAGVDAHAPEALALARWMSAPPELALEEHEASRRYEAWLRARGFALERGVSQPVL